MTDEELVVLLRMTGEPRDEQAADCIEKLKSQLRETKKLLWLVVRFEDIKLFSCDLAKAPDNPEITVTHDPHMTSFWVGVKDKS